MHEGGKQLAEHYYTARPTSEHAPGQVRYAMPDGTVMVFATDAGVFSKERIDRGTREMLKAVVPKPGDRVLDLGCGYGPIGIVLAALEPRAFVTMVDINERACELARRNLATNSISNAEVLCGDAFEVVGDRRFNIVVTNPPIRAGRRVLEAMVQGAHDRLADGGQLFLVIRTSQGAASMKAYMEGVFGNADEPEKGGGYRVIRSVRISAHDKA